MSAQRRWCVYGRLHRVQALSGSLARTYADGSTAQANCGSVAHGLPAADWGTSRSVKRPLLNDLAAKLESLDVLDGPASLAGSAVRQLVRDGPAKEALSGAWLGHALHPLLTDVPIGMWTSSVLLDWTGGRGSQSAADRLILTGLLATGAVIATGWSDWADVEQGNPAVRRSGIVHAALNATAVGLMIGSYMARKQGARGRGRVLSLGGTAVLGAGGWFGGHLSYTLGVGVTAGTPVASSEHLPQAG
jgi:uncharacterized membrane protein